MANEGVIWRFHKHLEIKNKERDQYKEAIHTLNEELIAKLKEETQLLEEAEKAKTNLTTELAALREQMDKAKVDAMAKFKVSQPFFNTGGVYYDDRFEDCLNKLGSSTQT